MSSAAPLGGLSGTRFRACPLCEAICGLRLEFDQGRLISARGDPDDPFSRGHICPKGTAMVDLEADPERLRRPMRRNGEAWEEIEWDEAFAWAGARIAEIQREHGNNAMAAYLGNPTVHHFGHLAYAPGLLRLLKTQNVYSASSVDQWPHQLVASQMYGHQFIIPIPDIDHTDYMLMLGANPLASNGSLMTVPGVRDRLKQLVKRGRLVVVDPRRTETAKLASEHLPIHPGADAGLLIKLLDALTTCGAPRLGELSGLLQGWDEAIAAVQQMAAGELDAGGISDERIHKLAQELYAAPRSAVYGRMGLSTQRYGSLCQWLIQLINIYNGQLDRPGGVLPNRAAIPVTGPATSRGARDRWRSRVRDLPEFAGELPVAVLAEEIETPGEGQIRGMLTVAGNPVLSTPKGDRLGRAMSGLEFMVSIDIYLNETTRHADLILPPASALSTDNYDLVFNAFAVRRVSRLNAAVAPREADERSDWEIFNGLAQAVATASDKPFRASPEPRALVGAMLQGGDSGLDLQTLLDHPHGIDMGPLEPCLASLIAHPDGKIQCAPPLLVEALHSYRSEPEEDPSALRLIGKREVRDNNSWMHNLPRLRKGGSRHALRMHPQDLESRQLSDGDWVQLRSAVGSVRTQVELSDELMPGVVCLPHGYGHQADGTGQDLASRDPGVSYNDLSDPAELDVPSGNAALNGLRVWVEAAPST